MDRIRNEIIISGLNMNRISHWATYIHLMDDGRKPKEAKKVQSRITTIAMRSSMYIRQKAKNQRNQQNEPTKLAQNEKILKGNIRKMD